ncbi:MAG: ABC transporter permease [Methanobacteriaceae archaeon]|nr:ABC transporter permease [Methanobacteriaceae archaeon]
MKILSLAKKEAYDILNNRIYLLVVFVQIFIVLGAFGLALVSSIATDPELLDQFQVNTEFKVGLSEELEDSPLAHYLKDENLNLIYFKSPQDARASVGSEVIAAVDIKPSTQNISVEIDTTSIFYPVISQKINQALNNYNQAVKLQNSGLNETEIKKVENPINVTEIKINENDKADIALDNPYFVEIMYGFIVPFILLLPFFLASNIVTDSIVGERERKTFEVLLMTPLTSFMVVLGKIIPILLFSLIQSVAWIFLLNFLRVPIYNPFIIFTLIFFIGLGFIGVGVILSMLVDSTKEANSAITLVLVFATFILFVPLFVNIPYLNAILNLIPTVLIVKISSSPHIDPGLILEFIPTILLSLIIFAVAVKYFKHERAIRL